MSPTWAIYGNERRLGVTPGAGGGFTGLLDQVSATAVAAYSSRRLLASYTANKSMLVTTSAGGNATQDIGFDGAGNFDTGSLHTFIGSNSGYVRTWYDQTLNSRDLTNSTVATQPIVVNAGTDQTENGHIAMTCVNASGHAALATGAFGTLNQPFTVCMALKYQSFVDFVWSNITSGFTYMGVYTASGPFYLLAASGGGQQATISAPTPDTTTLHTHYGVFNGASTNVYYIDNVDGGLNNTPGGTGGFASSDQMETGAAFTGGADCHLAELIIFNSVLGSTDRATIYANYRSYWGSN